MTYFKITLTVQLRSDGRKARVQEEGRSVRMLFEIIQMKDNGGFKQGSSGDSGGGKESYFGYILKI